MALYDIAEQFVCRHNLGRSYSLYLCIPHNNGNAPYYPQQRSLLAIAHRPYGHSYNSPHQVLTQVHLHRQQIPTDIEDTPQDYLVP
jgi:hypothetical protein